MNFKLDIAIGAEPSSAPASEQNYRPSSVIMGLEYLANEGDPKRNESLYSSPLAADGGDRAQQRPNFFFARAARGHDKLFIVAQSALKTWMTKKKFSAPALCAGVTITTLTPWRVNGAQAVVFAHPSQEKRAEKFDFDTTAMKWSNYNLLSSSRVIFIVFSPVQRWNVYVFYHYQQLPKYMFNWGAGVILAHHGDTSNYKKKLLQ